MHSLNHAIFACIVFVAFGVTVPASADDTALLEQITQEMADAVAPGDKAVWERYLDADVLYIDENNDVKTKPALLEELKPLPKGYSGFIKIEQFRMQAYPGIAVATYIQNETENVEGHVLHAKYRQTDTWRKTNAGWRLIAAQVLAIPKDPPETQLSPAQLSEYAGVYVLSEATRITVIVNGGALRADRKDRPSRDMKIEVRDVFFTPGRPRERRVFVRNAEGLVTGFVDRREGEDLPWRRE